MSIKLFKITAKALLVSLIITAVLLFIFNYIAIKNHDPDKFLFLFSIISLISAGFAGGVTSARLYPEKFIFSPIVFALEFIFLHFIFAIILGQGSEKPLSALLIYIGIIIAAIIGGIIGVPKKAKKSKTLKNYKKYKKSA